jgi:hypothetical protein
MPSSFVIVSTMESEPQSLQGVVVQTWRKYLPTGSRLYLPLEQYEDSEFGEGRGEGEGGVVRSLVHCVESGDFVDSHWRHFKDPGNLIHDTNTRPPQLSLSQIQKWHRRRLPVLWRILATHQSPYPISIAVPDDLFNPFHVLWRE